VLIGVMEGNVGFHVMADNRSGADETVSVLMMLCG
jgi:hypothetical protein